MAKQSQQSIEALEHKIKILEEDLAYEKRMNRKMLNLPENTLTEELAVSIPWSTEWMQEKISERNVTNGAITKVYKQRVVKLLQLEGGDIAISSHNGESARSDKDYTKISETFSKETFIMLLNLMEFSVKEFGIDRDAITNSLTDGEAFIIQKVINNF